MDRGSDYLHPKAYPLEFFFNSSTTINDYLLPPVDFSFEISHSIKKYIIVLGVFISYLSIVRCPLFPCF